MLQFKNKCFHLQPLLILVVFVQSCFHISAAEDCLRNGYNLAELDKFSPWKTVNDNTNAVFTISVCSKLSSDNNAGCPDGTAICAKYPNGTVINYGNYEEKPATSTGDQHGELMLAFRGESCPDFEGEKYSSILYFKCGKTLGHPYHVGDLGCSTHFEWESYLFCEDLKTPEKEVPCTVMKDGHLIDLSPLTKLTGGHLVDEVHNRKIFINVCRDIKAGPATDDATSHCPAGAAVCRVVDDKGDNFGYPTQRLQATSSGVQLVYESSTDLGGCSDKPKTTINFECPQRGGSKDPVLISDFLCVYEIRWVTEYACPVDYISSKTCQLTSDQHDIDIDLTPLKRIPFKQHPYMVNATSANKDFYRYYINVCGGLGFECGHANHGGSSVCQKKDGNDTFSKDLGEMQHGRLTYSDGELVLKYRNGDMCHTHFRRATFINFHCNKSAENDGIGYPVFEEESDCTYQFSWQTKYACIDHPKDDNCRVDANGKRFDLSTLVKEQGKNWEVLVSDGDEEESFYVNVCHDVLRKDETAKCPPGSAMCGVDRNGEGVSIGKYTEGLQYDEKSDSLKLVYTNGDKTEDDCVRTTAINFFCLPGVLDSAPKLVHQSEDKCYHELEWHTAAACILSHKTGRDCKVYDDDAGYHFDLSPLTKSEDSYTVNAEGYTYYINVCDQLKGDTVCNVEPHNNASVCQVKDSDKSQVKKVGEPGALIEYYDGVLNLTYTNGEVYHNPAHPHRMAEIAFLCDLNAGAGKPEYLVEKDYTYAFEWRTIYACPITPVECLVTDPATNKQYDLSSLSRTENWEVVDSKDPTQKKKFYINVCQPLSKVNGDHCSSFASSCVTKIDSNGKESLYHANLGRAETPPTIETSTNGIKLLYTRGNECEDNGVKKKFTTSIHFICDKGNLNGEPLVPVLIKPCEYSLIWETSAACPVDHVEPGTEDADGQKAAQHCSIKDPNSDFMFNLSPLKKRGDEYYEVKSGDGKKTYKLNICGSLSESACGKFDGSKPTSVCEGTSSVATVSSEMTFSSAGKITLNYKGKTDVGSGQEKRYTVNFYCKRTAQEPEVSLEEEEDYNINFRVYTSLACPPQTVDCRAVDDKGQEYDLSPLAREFKNWEVTDTRTSHGNLKYHINVCRPVVSTLLMTCTGGSVGGCQTGDHEYNMGYVQSKPVAASDGSAITILYQGGDKCHEGKEVEAYRSTRITFICDGIEHGPAFESESETCEYRFIWKTPSACPQHRVVGSGCKVQEPLYNFEFDLSVLRKTAANYKVPGDSYDFYLNVCGPLVASSNLCTEQNIGACQTGTTLSHPVEAGVGNDQLIYTSGELSLVYSDGKGNCHGKYNRTTIIQFLCDHSVTGEDGPRYLQETSDCIYMFEWKTKHACPPHEVIDCVFEHGTDTYDLSGLSRPHSNYEMVYNTSNKMYILNVCRSLVHRKGQTCPYGAAACEIDLSERDDTKKYHNMGTAASTSFSYDNDVVTLQYSNGDLCSDGKTHRSTKIIFSCSKELDEMGRPRSHFQSDGCTDGFFWTSSDACAIVKDKPSATDLGDCKVKNPQTGYEFDLSSLKSSRGYKTYDREGHMFEINVCDSLGNKDDCSDGTGSCRTEVLDGKKGTSAGKSNDKLKFRDGVLVLEYTDGDSCHSGSSQHATFINFVCHPGAGKGVPVFVDKSGDCEYYFDWHTDLVCETQIACSVTTDTGSVLDFSPLVRRSGKYNVLSNVAEDNRIQGMVYLNLCRPLNPVFGTLCPAGSGTCLVRPETSQKPLSLGRVHKGMIYDKVTKEARLTYDNGDACPSNPQVNISSIIILKCRKGERLDPELDRVTSDCQYIFTWFTPLACESTGVTEFSSSCKYYDKNTATTFDLSQLNQKRTVKGKDGRTFSLKPCGHLEDRGEKGEASCTEASVCVEGAGDKSGSLGRFDKAEASKNYYTLELKFSEGRTCTEAGTSMKATSTIMFKCDKTAGLGVPKLLESGDCHASFLWATSLLCLEEREECIVSDGSAMFDFNFLSQDSGSWNHTDSHKNVYWLNLCQPVQGPTIAPACPTNAAVCTKLQDGKVAMLGEVDTQVITVEDSSKDHSSVLIQYSQGDASVCSKGRRQRRDLSPSVSIHLKCADTLGAPVLLEDKLDDEKCIFEFEWKTRIACQIGKNAKEVPLNEGKLLDSRSGKIVDLNPLLKQSIQPPSPIGDKHYSISLSGQQPDSGADTGATNGACKGAAICQKAENTQMYRNLGSASTRTFYVKDEIIEAVFTSPDKCTGKNKAKNVTSTIVFNCAQDSNKNKVELLYHTSDCGYIFTWDTQVVCFHAKPSSSSADGSQNTGDDESTSVHKGSSGGSSGGAKVVVGVSIVIGIVVICILILVLHRPERRASLKMKVKSCILCRKSTEFMSYSKLSSSEADADLNFDDDPFNPFNEPDEEAEINNGQLPVQVHSFHDDSDDDLLL